LLNFVRCFCCGPFSGFFSFLLISGCVTWEAAGPQNLSPEFLANFAPCQGDGLVELEIGHDRRIVASPSLEWIAESPGLLKLDMFEPGVKSLMQLEWSAAGLKVTAAGLRSDFLSVRNGFLYLDNDDTKIRAQEMACLLSFHFPADWLKDLRLDVASGRARRQEPEREIRFLPYRRTASGPPEPLCAQILDARLLGLVRYDRQICLHRNGLGRIAIDSVGYIEWRSKDASNG
jgi:hypothetical protein